MQINEFIIMQCSTGLIDFIQMNIILIRKKDSDFYIFIYFILIIDILYLYDGKFRYQPCRLKLITQSNKKT